MSYLSIATIKSQIVLKDYIEVRTGIPFKQTGSDYRAKRCPFCQSATGFTIASAKPGLAHCFACGFSGDVVEFEKKYSNCTLQEAIKIVKAQTGADYTQTPPHTQQPKQPYKKQETDQKKKKFVHRYIWDVSRPMPADILRKWLEKERGFGPFVDKAVGLVKDRIRLNVHKGEQSIVIPISSYHNNEMVGVQTISLKDGSKKTHGTNKGVFVIETGSKGVIFLESWTNALASAVVGHTGISLFGAGNSGDIPAIIDNIQNKESKDFYIWLDKDKQGQDNIAKFQLAALKGTEALKGIYFQDNKDNGYDVNDLLKQEQDNFAKAVEYYIAKAVSYTDMQKASLEKKVQADRLAEIQDIPAKDVPEAVKEDKAAIAFRKALNISQKVVLFLSGATGIGKTYQVILEIIANLHKGEASTLFCSTLTEVDRAIGMIKSLLPVELHCEISRVTSTKTWLYSEESINLNLHIGLIAVTTYAYLGFNGEIDKLFKKAQKLIDNRNVYCDEAHELHLRTLIFSPLAARYLFRIGDGTEGTYRLFQKCPHKAKKGGCKNCFLAYLKEALGPNNERNFYKSFTESAFHKHAEHPVFPMILPWGQIESTKKYSRISSTLFYQPLEIEPVYNLDDFSQASLLPGEQDPDKSYFEFIKARVRHLYNPHLRMELPVIAGQEVNEAGQIVKTAKPVYPDAIEYLSDEEQAQVQCPVSACQIPYLCGVSLLPYLQLLNAKRLVFTSATLPEPMITVINDVAVKKDWSTRHIEVEDVSFRFNVTMLKMSQRLSLDKQAKIVKEIRERLPKEKQFIVTSVKPEARTVYKALKTTLGAEVELFWREDFISMTEERVYVNGYGAKIVTVTYGRSAITKGVDMPTVTFVMVDVNQFLPQIAVSNIRPGMSKEEIRQKATGHIRWNVCQVLGRPLRSLEKRIPGVVQVDPRQIVLLAHGLPADLMDFELDKKILHEYREYRNYFVSSLPSHVVGSICDATVACKTGSVPVDRADIDRQIVRDKALVKGIEFLSQRERSLLTSEDRVELANLRAGQKPNDLEQKVIEAAQAGTTWKTSVYRKNNLHRLPKKEQARLKKTFIQHNRR